MVNRYVTVPTDTTDRAIKHGPLLWDGTTALTAPQGTKLILEADALAQGYTYPPVAIDVANAVTLRQRALTALTNDAAYLAIAAPTNAQAVAQTAALTRQVSGIIRLLLNQTTDISGT